MLGDGEPRLEFGDGTNHFFDPVEVPAGTAAAASQEPPNRVVIANAPSAVSIDTVTVADLPTTIVPPGRVLRIVASFVDPGTLDEHEATVEWGDGAIESVPVEEDPFGPPGSVEGMTGSLQAEHVYDECGTARIHVRVRDDDTGDAAVAAAIVNVEVAEAPAIVCPDV